MTFTKTLRQQGKLTRIHPERKIKHNPDQAREPLKKER